MASQELINKRASAINSIRNIARFIHVYNEQTDNISKLQVRYDSLLKLWDTYDGVQSEIEMADESEITKRNETEELFFDTKAAYQSELLKRKTPTSSVRQADIEVKLVLLQLIIPEFNGEYQQWKKGFYDMYASMIHNNQDLSSVQKFYYLKKALGEEPLKVINSIPTTELNYDMAWQLLCERYDNDQYIISTHMQSLFEQPAMQKGSVKDLRRLITDTKQHARSLENLQLPVDKWDMVIIYFVLKKLDNENRQQWEFHKQKTTTPTLNSFYAFLEQRCRALEMIASTTTTNQVLPQDSKVRKFMKTTHVVVQTNKACPICQESGHMTYNCSKFKGLNTPERINAVRSAHLCFHCLNPNCSSKTCKFKACKYCGRKHNCLLHTFTVGKVHDNELTVAAPAPSKPRDVSNNQGVMSKSTVNEQVALVSAEINSCPTIKGNLADEVMIPTAVVYVYNNNNQKCKARALLDIASQSSFITRNLVQELELKPQKSNVSIGGINQAMASAESSVHLKIESCSSSYRKSIDCLVLDKITTALPNHRIKYEHWNIPENLVLADPDFNQPASIELLLGAELFLELLEEGQVRIGKQLPILQNTKLGWIISGKIEQKIEKTQNFLCRIDTQAHDQLVKFWSVEDVSDKQVITKEEQLCETIFATTTKRDPDGRFIVNLPMSGR